MAYGVMAASKKACNGGKDQAAWPGENGEALAAAVTVMSKPAIFVIWRQPALNVSGVAKISGWRRRRKQRRLAASMANGANQLKWRKYQSESAAAASA
jgi:hypothetical protein